ncbi:TetR/AcrR family transcriptional regulator [Chamaesiphon minutus]|uniref:TetR/AcrR family transcriptional regulator n=1 Tax=Chamaesiphon minutus TaxID=1173032 RepID=UPI0002D99060|nr:TetR/AcrR family transcriptional regulator [Chamaesiphon minutus]
MNESPKSMAPDRPPAPKGVGKISKSLSAAATRDRLLHATSHIIQTQGIERLTLDAVAKEAKVSKGGLLYHFATKEALIAGVVQSLMDEFDADIERELALDRSPESPGRWLRAYVKATFNGKPLATKLISSLVLVATCNPELLQLVQGKFDAWQQKILASGLDPVRANLVRLATDGFGDAELFGYMPPNPALRQDLLAMLLAMIQEAESDDIHITKVLEQR